MSDVASSPPPAADVASSAPRRKSGRVVRKPDHFVPASSPAHSAKRKRGEDHDEDDPEMPDASTESEEQESSEGEPDEEELKERRRSRKKGKAAPRKPAAKKPKTSNGEAISLTIRPATQKKPRKPRKVPIRKSAVADDAAGLYADVFGARDSLEDIAAKWTNGFAEHETASVADLVNFILKSAGCNIQVTEDEIADVDNVAGTLEEIQEKFEAETITDYPLLGKTRGTIAFKHALQAFFRALIHTFTTTGVLYEKEDLLANIENWLGGMSSCGNRPFRHTSTVALLAIVSALCEVASGLVENMAKKARQSETEAKKARVNKARVAALQKEVDEIKQRRGLVDERVKSLFDSVFIHRYRDVDPKIRVDCVEALADWIESYPDHFFDGSKLRYLGWILSDTNFHVRHEVIRQLQKLYRDNDKLGGLKTFTERFRPRMVEMATLDAEATVRAAAVELLDILREAGLLEPDDVDTIGQLIFDAEPKVRKAVVGFFAENVNTAYGSQIDEMGGQENVEGVFPDEDDENYNIPRLEWIKLKCLVELLQAYDTDDGDLPSQIERISGSTYALVAAGIESRFSLAAQALCDYIPEVKKWEILAGYLLYDHSQTAAGGDDPEGVLRQYCKLSEREEMILLEVLNASVKHQLVASVEGPKEKKARKTKLQRQAELDEQAESARSLAVLIPRLLKKFGAQPEAASSVLNLQQVLNLDVFEELRQDTTFASLLDDVNKQFLTHQNERVLLEASEALRHAQSNEDLKEITEGKIQQLWDTTITAFNTLKRGRDFKTRGSFSENILTGISNTVLRIGNLAKVCDCTTILEQTPAAPSNARSKSRSTPQDTEPPILSLIHLLDRGVPVANLAPEVDAAEDALVRHTMGTLLPYFMWKVVHWRQHLEAGTAIPDHDITDVAERRDACVLALIRVMQSRKRADDLRIDASCLLLDLHNMFIVLRQVELQRKSRVRRDGEEEVNNDWEALCQDVAPETTKLLLQVLSAAESQFAKRANKQLADVDVDDDPMDPDEEPESEEEEDEEADERAAEEKKWRTLLAEQRLCELGSRMVMSVLAGTLDGKNAKGRNIVKNRLERNKLKLGHDWKEVVGHLDATKRRPTGRKGRGKADDKAPEKRAKNAAIVVEDDSEGEEEHREEEVEHEEEHEENEGEREAEEEENGGEREENEGEREDIEAEPMDVDEEQENDEAPNGVRRSFSGSESPNGS